MKRDVLAQRNVPVWLFLSGGAALLLLLLGGLAREQGWFAHTIELRFHASNANELRTGMQVRLSGFPIGKVSDVELDELAQVQVTMQIGADYQKFLGQGSRAGKARDGLFGDSYIELTPGKIGTTLAEDSQLPFDDDPGLGAVVYQLRDRLLPVLDNLQQFSASLNDPNGEFRQLASEARLLLGEVRHSRQQLDKALASLNRLAEQKLPQTLTETEASLQALRTLAGNTDQRLAAISTQLQTTLLTLEQGGQQATTAVQTLQQLLDDTRPQLQTVLQDAEALLKNANTTVDNMQTHWPFTPPSDKAKPAKPPAR